MPNIKKSPRIRWPVESHTALELDRFRMLLGFKSWNEFFNEIIRILSVQDQNIPTLATALISLDRRLDRIESAFSKIVESSEKQTLELNEFATLLEDNTMMIRSIQDIISVSVNTEETPKLPTKPHPLPALARRLKEIGV